MIKQIIVPQFAKHDITNSEMPEVYFDEAAKTKIYLYATNQEFNDIFIDEDTSNARIVQYKLDSVVDAWMGQNLTKQINPYQGSSAAKTIAMQSEIELYLFKDFRNIIDRKFYFFTFEPINGADDIRKIPKFFIKESTPNFDKTKFRFSKIKAWQLSSVLFKQFQYWVFQPTADISRTKISKIILKFDSGSLFGNIRIEYSKFLGAQPQEADWTLSSIITPFESIEPLAVNFSYKNGSLYYQLVNWDLLGNAIADCQNYKFAGLETGLTKSETTLFEKKKYGVAKYLAGATLNPGAPAGSIYGLGEALLTGAPRMKEAPNDLKMYIYPIQTTFGINQRDYWDVKKCSPINSLKQQESFLKNGQNTFNINPWWEEWDEEYYGNKFYSAKYQVLNQESFTISNALINTSKEAKDYVWVMAPAINFFNRGVFSNKTGGKNTWTNSSYYSYGTLPWGFLSNQQIIQILNGQKTNNSLSENIITIDFETPIYLNNVSIALLLADKLKIKTIDINGISTEFETYTNYFYDQQQITTKVSFF